MEARELMRVLEGILFSLGRSVSAEEIAGALDLERERVQQAMEELRLLYEREERGIQILRLEDAYQMCSNRSIYQALIQIAKQPKKQSLTDVMLETLSIIAYKQPVTKAEVEKIRGVSSDHAINRLVDYRLIQELGRLDAPGRPMLFGTTEEFLRAFGVSSLEELPAMNPLAVEELREEAREEAENQLELDL